MPTTNVSPTSPVEGAAVLFYPTEPQGVPDRVTYGARSPRHRRRRPEIMTTQNQDGPDAVVIGAGPAGLAVARELDHQHGIKALVLDRAAAPAISWRTRYDNFRLNTTGFLSHLPGQRIPLNAGRWPTKEDMVRYFDRYVQRQNISLLLGCDVHRVDRAAGGWRLDTSSGEIRTPAIVLATGNYSAPSIPAWPGLQSLQRRDRSLRGLHKRLALPRSRRPRCGRWQFGRRHRCPAR